MIYCRVQISIKFLSFPTFHLQQWPTCNSKHEINDCFFFFFLSFPYNINHEFTPDTNIQKISDRTFQQCSVSFSRIILKNTADNTNGGGGILCSWKTIWYSTVFFFIVISTLFILWSLFYYYFFFNERVF